MKKDLRQDSGWLVFGALLAGVAFMVTGCAGVGIKAEAYRIDEIRHSQQTHRSPIPWKCYLWADCTATQAPANNGGMVEGS